MWLRNFYNILAWLLFMPATSTSNFDDNNISVKKPTGSYWKYLGDESGTPTIVKLFPTNNGGFAQGISGTMNSTSMYGIGFGGGNTPVTFDDYALASSLNMTYSIANKTQGTPTYDSTTRTWSNTVEFDLKNTSSTDYDIKEVGLFNGAYTLIYREVLANPFTLQAGQTVHYIHTFKFTMPEH